LSNVKLQVALDFIELDRAVDVALAAVAGGADYIEAGTPLIKSEGLDCIRKLRALFPEKTLIADMKTMDAGRIEAEAAAKAGADMMTVLGASSKGTILECVEAGRHYGIKVAVDLLGLTDAKQFAKNADQLGIIWLNIHCAIDDQMLGENPFKQLRNIRKCTKLTLSVAGGINSETAADAVKEGADVIIVGGAITKAVNVEQATRDIRRAIDTRKAVKTDLFKRTTTENLRQGFLNVRTSNISDGMHRAPCLKNIYPLIKGNNICGQAVTVKTIPGDWAKPVEAIDVAKEGDVIVIDACGQAPAIWGELATESAKNKGLAGLVVNGAVRDTSDIRRLDFSVWTKLITAHAGDPHGLGEINVPITIEGQAIEPGDWIIADDDGVIVVPKARAVEIVNRAADVLETENRIRQEILDRKSTLARVVNLKRWEKEGIKSARNAIR
jgi:3-hexulose-6-phosphate synthase/6-phospho-3-hexuloisomerase